MNTKFFYKGKNDVLEEMSPQDINSGSDLKKIQKEFLKVLDNKNLSFLLGSGCSSYESGVATDIGETKETMQVGVPIMKSLAGEFYGQKDFLKCKGNLCRHFKINVNDDTFRTNLEMFLSALYSLSFYYSKAEKDRKDKVAEKMVNAIIQDTRSFLLRKILNEENIKNNNDAPLLNIYKVFYRKLLSRNPTLPRLNIFTTNYDLYSERAMDLLGIHYANGFIGGISKFFNPTIFNYALAEKMDLSQSKWSVIDNFFYLYKLHGSVNWVEAEESNKLFKVKEIQEPTFDSLKDKEIMIYPTPLKYNASFGSPYSDLFREFQRKLMIGNNILVVVGYSFSDEHINNIIFQAFTIPSFRLIILGDPTQNDKLNELKEMDDSRVWIIGESFAEGEKKVPLHYFERFVKEILPDLTNEDLDEKMEKTFENLKDLLK